MMQAGDPYRWLSASANQTVVARIGIQVFNVSNHIAQNDLFEATGQWPEGLAYVSDFVSPTEERGLLVAIQALPLHEAKYRIYTARRRVMSFGSEYDFDGNALRPAPDVPVWLEPLQRKVAHWAGVGPDELRHVLVAEYQPGTALGWHRDAPSFDIVIGVSLAGRCRMRFRPYPHVTHAKRDTFALDLAPRSAYILRGAIRRRWQHSIPATKMLRYSITFRTLAIRRSKGQEAMAS